eukprot:TRINITY_DN62738_c0_g1_i1.p1 TRINITY_DN62738_c0_g1~~TRINITY_DN62738_c0_g1_i1.p1  ORF type:complete len:505 (-),score=55.42 TRINITY_DN62738_c0_g1_i1:87-1478(-)
MHGFLMLCEPRSGGLGCDSTSGEAMRALLSDANSLTCVTYELMCLLVRVRMWEVGFWRGLRDLSRASTALARLRRIRSWLLQQDLHNASTAAFARERVETWWGSVEEAHEFFLKHEARAYAQSRRSTQVLSARLSPLRASNDGPADVKHTNTGGNTRRFAELEAVTVLLAGDVAHVKSWALSVDLWREYAHRHLISLRIDTGGGETIPRIDNGFVDDGGSHDEEMLAEIAGLATPDIEAARPGGSSWRKWLAVRRALDEPSRTATQGKTGWIVLVELDMLLSPQCFGWDMRHILRQSDSDFVLRRPRAGLNTGFLALRHGDTSRRLVASVLAKGAGWRWLPRADDDALAESLLELDYHYSSECLQRIWPARSEDYRVLTYQTCWNAHWRGGADFVDPANVDLNYLITGDSPPPYFPFLTHLAGCRPTDKGGWLAAWRAWNATAWNCTLGSEAPLCPEGLAICG